MLLVKVITWTSVVLAGLVSFTDSTEIWLNELKVTDGEGVKWFDVELVGHPLTTEYPTAPTKLETTLQFYDGNADAGGEIEVELARYSFHWRGNYMFNQHCAGRTECADAARGPLGGVRITYGGVSKVYCWGTGAKDGEPIGPPLPTQLRCTEEYILDGYEPPSDSFTDIALYDTTRGSGAASQGWEYRLSLDATTPDPVPFATVGTLNVCPPSPSVNCEGITGQSIAAYTYSPPEIWLNELKVTLTDATDYSIDVELVGRPLTMDYPEQPEKMEAKVQFYSGTDNAGGEEDVELVVVSTDGNWDGNYMGQHTCERSATGCATAATGTLGGVKITYGGVSKVYCWGTGARHGANIGPSAPQTQLTCTDGYILGGYTKPTTEGFTDIALYDTSEGSGAKSESWVYKVSLDGTADKPYDTLGILNVCGDVSASAALDCTGVAVQSIAAYTYVAPPQDEAVSSSVSLFICSRRSQGALVVIGVMTLILTVTM